MFTIQPRTGCRFLTVDACREAFPFYQKNYFKFLTGQDLEDDTRIMYFDLKTV
ncbi:MAG: hypothetical protein LBS79_06925 [Tannerella sp.]|nr:hypothetical protein [Tannerella sp.]